MSESQALPPQLEISYGTDADIPYYLDLGLRTINTSTSPGRPAPYEALAAAFGRLITYVFSVSHVPLLAKIGGQRVGYLILLDQLPDDITNTAQCYVAYTAVEPEFRRRGIARALMHRAEDETRARGLKYLTLMVTYENKSALNLYTDLGFVTERFQMCKTLS